jgi:hypothetical protein
MGIGMNKGQLIYLAVPYSHKDPKIQDSRFKKVNAVAAKIISSGKYVFSPISQATPIAAEGELPRGWDFWKGYDEVMISRCDRVWVLMLEGWRESIGVNGEIKIAEKLGKPVEYIDESAVPFRPGDIIKVQPLNQPSGLAFYLDPAKKLTDDY